MTRSKPCGAYFLHQNRCEYFSPWQHVASSSRHCVWRGRLGPSSGAARDISVQMVDWDVSWEAAVGKVREVWELMAWAGNRELVNGCGAGAGKEDVLLRMKEEGERCGESPSMTQLVPQARTGRRRRRRGADTATPRINRFWATCLV